MATLVKSGNVAHDTACLAATVAYQSAIVGLGMNAAAQVTLNNAEITWARACLASCRANNNGVGVEIYQSLLRALGTGGN